jgi:hypothetical protein
LARRGHGNEPFAGDVGIAGDDDFDLSTVARVGDGAITIEQFQQRYADYLRQGPSPIGPPERLGPALPNGSPAFIQALGQ